MANRKTTTDQQPATWYAGFLAKWPTAQVGAAPTAAMWAIAAALAKRAPNLEAVNIAMNFRPIGATVAEYIMASGAEGPARNHRKNLVTAGHVSPLTSGGRHYLKLTEAGKARCMAAGMRAGDLAGLVVTGKGATKTAPVTAPKATAAPKAARVTRKRNKAPAPVTAPVEAPQVEATAPQADQQPTA